MTKSLILLLVVVTICGLANPHPIDSPNSTDLNNNESTTSSTIDSQESSVTEDNDNESEEKDDYTYDQPKYEDGEDSKEVQTHEIVKRSPNKHRIGKRSPNKHRIRHNHQQRRRKYNPNHIIEKRDRHHKNNGHLSDIHNISKRNKHSMSNGEGNHQHYKKSILSAPVPTLVYLDNSYDEFPAK